MKHEELIEIQVQFNNIHIKCKKQIAQRDAKQKMVLMSRPQPHSNNPLKNLKITSFLSYSDYRMKFSVFYRGIKFFYFKRRTSKNEFHLHEFRLDMSSQIP